MLKMCFLNSVCSRFSFAYQTRYLSKRYAESRIQAGATIHQKRKMFMPAFLKLKMQCAKQSFSLKKEQLASVSV